MVELVIRHIYLSQAEEILVRFPFFKSSNTPIAHTTVST